jgi:hypothetical protein
MAMNGVLAHFVADLIWLGLGIVLFAQDANLIYMPGGKGT